MPMRVTTAFALPTSWEPTKSCSPAATWRIPPTTNSRTRMTITSQARRQSGLDQGDEQSGDDSLVGGEIEERARPPRERAIHPSRKRNVGGDRRENGEEARAGVDRSRTTSTG